MLTLRRKEVWVIRRVYSWSIVLERRKWSWDQLKDQNYKSRANKGQNFAMEHILESGYLGLWAWYKLVKILPRYFCQFSATFWSQNTLYIPKMESEGVLLSVLGMKGRFGLREFVSRCNSHRWTPTSSCRSLPVPGVVSGLTSGLGSSWASFTRSLLSPASSYSPGLFAF